MRAALLLVGGTGCFTQLQITQQATIHDAELAPQFALQAQDGASVTLASAVEQGPVVLVFYRGHW